MTLRQKQVFYLSLIGILLGIIVSSIYYLLGGFEEIKVYKLDPTVRTIAGKEFYSHYTDTAPIDFGTKCRQMLDSGDISGQLVTVNYLTDTLASDKIHQFIGVELSEDMSEMPNDFTIKTYRCDERYAVFLSMHVLVQPRPQIVEGMLLHKAIEENVALRDYFFEIRYPDNSLSVEGWVK